MNALHVYGPPVASLLALFFWTPCVVFGEPLWAVFGSTRGSNL